jgi:hypothetical protein
VAAMGSAARYTDIFKLLLDVEFVDSCIFLSPVKRKDRTDREVYFHFFQLDSLSSTFDQVTDSFRVPRYGDLQERYEHVRMVENDGRYRAIR